ncbi:MarR family transcriptional regulator [Mycobacterium sp. 1245499.0]|uniref:MarR family winged helix-turn-helix transcriptional regulator n=1 Tax=Mycobacterium sp. 1245499.0 TaxID=1834074 RepID=UPI0008010174|nr:MarR family transcriptional regulator [Mycobacterium sp. 1245499.0]OBL15617.1 MarR family transcriptional regulator [Mycobacterium sp. 1245499.0]
MGDSNALAEEDEICELGWALGMLARDYRVHVETELRDFPRGSRGYQLLYTVVRKRIRTQVELADYLGIDRSVMPYVIDDLVDAGLVDRTPDPSDRRVRTIVATKRGLQTLRELEASMAAAEATFLEALSAPQQHEFRKLLSQVARQSRLHVRDAKSRDQDPDA